MTNEEKINILREKRTQYINEIQAYKEIGNVPVPIICRLQGTNAVEAKKLIDDSGLKVYSAIALKEAADLVTKVLA